MAAKTTAPDDDEVVTMKHKDLGDSRATATRRQLREVWTAKGWTEDAATNPAEVNSATTPEAGA